MYVSYAKPLCLRLLSYVGTQNVKSGVGGVLFQFAEQV